MGTTAVTRLNWKRLGNEVRMQRENKGWNQRQAAVVVRRSQPDLSTFENGKLQLTVEALAVWSDALGMSIHDMIDILLSQDETTSISEKEAADVLGWSTKRVARNRDLLGGRLHFSEDENCERWMYHAYRVHDVARRDAVREYFRGEGWPDKGEI